MKAEHNYNHCGGDDDDDDLVDDDDAGDAGGGGGGLCHWSWLWMLIILAKHRFFPDIQNDSCPEGMKQSP